MRIANTYSHLNGLEFMLVRKSALWQEIQDAVNNVEASLAFEKVSREKTMMGKILLSPSKLNVMFKAEFSAMGWHEARHDYYVNEDLNTAREIVYIIMSMMSSGVAWYENELANIVREGRSNPSVPVILIGIEP